MDKPLPEDFDPYGRGDMRISNDAQGFTLFLQWILGIASIVGATALIWVAASVATLREDVAVLKDRPPPVTKPEFDVRMESVDRRLSALEARK